MANTRLTSYSLPGGFSFFSPATPSGLSLLFPLPVATTPGEEVPGTFDDQLASLQIGTAGLVLQVQLLDLSGNPINISAALTLKLKLGLPDLSTRDFVAAFLTNGTDGTIQYTTQAGDLSVPGIYSIQGEITLPSGGVFPTRLGYFRVLENVDNN